MDASLGSRCAKAATSESRAIGGSAQGDEDQAPSQLQARAEPDKDEAEDEAADLDDAEAGNHCGLRAGRDGLAAPLDLLGQRDARDAHHPRAYERGF